MGDAGHLQEKEVEVEMEVGVGEHQEPKATGEYEAGGEEGGGAPGPPQ